jgi:hypothetical protein
MNCFNSLVLTPVLLALFAPARSSAGGETPRHAEPNSQIVAAPGRAPPDMIGDLSRIVKSHSDKVQVHGGKRDKKRGFNRVQSEISLSTISEEP